MSGLSVLEQVMSGPTVNAGQATPSTQPPKPDDEQAASTGHSRANLVRELFVRAREARRDQLAQWKRNYVALNNRAYKPGASPWDEEPAVSSIWPVIASAVAWETDQRPQLEVTPTAEAFSPYWNFYQELAQDMNTCLNATFTTNLLDGEIAKMLWDVKTYGVGYTKTTWEPWLADGLGDSAFRRVDPFTIYPDPHAKSPADLSYIIEAKQMTIADVDRAFPGAGKSLRSAMILEDAEEAPTKLDGKVDPRAPRVAMGALAPNTSPSYSNVAGGRNPDEQVVTVLEAWVRGHKIEKTKDPKVTRVRDEWRCIVVSGGVVLLDEKASDINAYGTHPFDRCVLMDTGEWYGPCLVELLSPIQRIINWLLHAFNRNIYLAGNPVLVEDMRSASRNKRFTNRPGQRIEAQGGTGAVGWMSPPQVAPQIASSLIQYYEGKIETISGLSAMVRGFAPNGRNSEGVLDSVQDSAFVRVRLSLRELERSLRGVATKMAANIAEFYTEERLMSLIGPDGQRTHLALRARHFYTVDENAENPYSAPRIPLRFSLTADAGSQLPTSKQARAAEAKHLFSIGAIDIYELLKAMQWPNYALVAQRVMEMQAQQAQSEAAKKKS